MLCPFCGHIEDKVVDSRESKDGVSIRRRRECLKCSRRFTSYERIDEIPYMVEKKDGSRTVFDRGKVISGIQKACERRPVSASDYEAIVGEIEREVQDSPKRELSTQEIGNIIMRRLKSLDKVAYVRFASVYRDFTDVSDFMDEVKALVRSKTPSKKGKKGKK